MSSTGKGSSVPGNTPTATIPTDDDLPAIDAVNLDAASTGGSATPATGSDADTDTDTDGGRRGAAAGRGDGGAEGHGQRLPQAVWH